MDPLYDANVNLVGWIDPGHHIFGTDMDWLAYISGGHAWSSSSGNWCGSVDGFTCRDRSGRVVAWSPIEQPRGSVAPVRPVRAVRVVRAVRPVRPVTPVRPVRPVAPVGGWSQQSFEAWVAGE